MPIMISGLKGIQRTEDNLIVIDVVAYGTEQGEHTGASFEIMFRDWNKLLKGIKEDGTFELRFLLKEHDAAKLLLKN